jgi:hypothetical protein
MGSAPAAGRERSVDFLTLVARTLRVRGNDVGTEVGKLEVAQAEHVSPSEDHRALDHVLQPWKSQIL